MQRSTQVFLGFLALSLVLAEFRGLGRAGEGKRIVVVKKGTSGRRKIVKPVPCDSTVHTVSRRHGSVVVKRSKPACSEVIPPVTWEVTSASDSCTDTSNSDWSSDTDSSDWSSDSTSDSYSSDSDSDHCISNGYIRPGCYYAPVEPQVQVIRYREATPLSNRVLRCETVNVTSDDDSDHVVLDDIRTSRPRYKIVKKLKNRIPRVTKRCFLVQDDGEEQEIEVVTKKQIKQVQTQSQSQSQSGISLGLSLGSQQQQQQQQQSLIE